MQAEHVPENDFAQPTLSTDYVIYNFPKHRRQIALGFAEFTDDPLLLVALHLDKNVLLCWEVEVERSSHHTRSSGDGSDISGGQPALRNFSQRGVEQPGSGFESANLPDAPGCGFSNGWSFW